MLIKSRINHKELNLKQGRKHYSKKTDQATEKMGESIEDKDKNIELKDNKIN